MSACGSEACGVLAGVLPGLMRERDESMVLVRRVQYCNLSYVEVCSWDPGIS